MLIKKILTSFLLILTTSCSSSELFNYHNPQYNTEIKCREYGYQILLLEFGVNDINRAIDKAVKKKEENQTEENYTILSLPNKKSVMIPRITPDKMRQSCSFLQIPIEDGNTNAYKGFYSR